MGRRAKDHQAAKRKAEGRGARKRKRKTQHKPHLPSFLVKKRPELVRYHQAPAFLFPSIRRRNSLRKGKKLNYLLRTNLSRLDVRDRRHSFSVMINVMLRWWNHGQR